LVSLVAATNRELWIPKFGASLSRNVQDLVGSRKQRLHPSHDRVTQVILAGEEVNFGERRVVAPRFELPNTFGPWAGQLKAPFAESLTASDEHPAGYLFTDVDWPADPTEAVDVILAGQPVLMTPANHAWLGPNQCFLASDVPLAQLAGANSASRFASTPEILRDLQNPSVEVGRDTLVSLHARFVQPILEVALMFSGLGVTLHRIARNVFVASGYAMLLVALHFGVTLASHSLGIGFLVSASMAAWLPVVVMVPLSVWLSSSLSH